MSEGNEAPEELTIALREALTSAGMPAPAEANEEEGLEAEPWPLELISSGTASLFYRLEYQGTYFVKWNEKALPDMFQRERESLDTLTERGTILQIPKVFAPAPQGTYGSKVLVMELLKPSPNGTGRNAWLALGRGLAELHRRHANSYGFGSDNYCGSTAQENAWTDDWVEFFSVHRLGAMLKQVELSHKLIGREVEVFLSLIRKLPSLLPRKPLPSLCHGELWKENYMDSAEGPALFDPACCYGDREMDLCTLPLAGGFPEDVLEAYNHAWPLDPGWQERFPIYQLYHMLNHYLLYGGQYGEDALRIARKYL